MTVVVVDDGVEHTIKDIQPNYVSAGSAAGGRVLGELPTSRCSRGKESRAPRGDRGSVCRAPRAATT